MSNILEKERTSYLTESFSSQDLKGLTLDGLKELAEEIRQRILTVLSVNGGHLSSNLGIIELTIALHKVFSSPKDPFIFDVSHQCYPHKIITGRNARFPTLRKYQGISGFSDPTESAHDHFYAGHAGTALSLALGVASARDFFQEDYHVLPILGDASLTCGLTLEAFNNIPPSLKKLIVILNDNKMSISQNVGNIKNIMSRFVNSPTANKLYFEVQSFLKKIPSLGEKIANQGKLLTESMKNLVSPAVFFEHFGLSYVGPIDGHDIGKLISTFKALKDTPRPVLVHVLTQKGRGLPAAMQNPTSYHGVKPFDLVSGKFLPSPSKRPTFPKIFGKHLVKMGQENPYFMVVTPATPAGASLEDFMKLFPKRSLDVGIAEGHAVTFSGGLSYCRKMKVICSVYATFLQRAFDNVFQDVCLQRLPVIFTLDRSFISGPDGSTHHGIYDIAFLTSMPNMIVCQPRNGQLLKELLESAFSYDSPISIRYPNLPTEEGSSFLQKRKLGKAEVLAYGEKVVILALGHLNEMAQKARELLEKKGIFPTIIDPIFLKPLDTDLLYDVISKHHLVLTLEEHCVTSGLGSLINNFLFQHQLNKHISVINLGIPSAFIEHGDREILLKKAGLSAESIAKYIENHFEWEKTGLS